MFFSLSIQFVHDNPLCPPFMSLFLLFAAIAMPDIIPPPLADAIIVSKFGTSSNSSRAIVPYYIYKKSMHIDLLCI